MLANRLKKRLRHLGKWAKRTGTRAFRLYDRDIPEIPLLLDIYSYPAPDAVISGALYKRPYEKDEAEESLWLNAMQDAAAQALGVKRENIIVKLRQKQTGQGQYEKVSRQGVSREVCEGAIRFKVNLSDYLDTGLFLDRRVMRQMVGAQSGGKRVLNLFCYTASFSLHAASGSAASTDSVDLSNTYLKWAQHNFFLNGFNAKMQKSETYFDLGKNRIADHVLIRSDVPAFLKSAKTARLYWDSVIVDPPAFSNSKMTDNDFDLQRDYLELLNATLAVLAPGGRIWFSANARSFKCDADEMEKTLAKKFPGIAVTDISCKTVDEDFKGRKTPKAFVLDRPPTA